MTERYLERQRMKKERAAYRLAAVDLCKQLTDSGVASIGVNGVLPSVQVTEGGAFVECNLWIKEEQMVMKQAELDTPVPPPTPVEPEPKHRNKFVADVDEIGHDNNDGD